MLDSILSAKESVTLRSWYFLPGEEITNALLSQAEQGVRLTPCSPTTPACRLLIWRIVAYAVDWKRLACRCCDITAVSQVTPETPTAAVTPEPITPTLVLPEATDTPQPTKTPTITPTPEPGIGSTRIRPADEAVMVFVPAGEFTMGSEDGEDEIPVQAVNLDSYWLDQTEVTNAQFAQFVAAANYETTAEKEGGGYAAVDGNWGYVDGADWQHPRGPDSDLTGRDEHPVVLVSWLDAVAYCEWAGGRLPTEAEWEKAARWDEEAQEARTYPWGETIDCDRANYTPSCIGDTTAVGSYPDGASPYGALDMAGNVWEWVADWYASAYYTDLVYDNPTGPQTGDYRVVRGGSWDGNDYNARAANRLDYDPTVLYYSVGFRCAQ